MDPEQWEAINEIFHAAIELDPARRKALLDSACRDPDVRREVESLIAANDAAGDFIRNSPSQISLPSTPSVDRLASLRNYDPETGGEKIAAPIVAHSIFSRRVVPSFIVDISEWLDAKLDAIRAHSSQFYDPDSNEPETMLTGKSYLDRLASQARYYGALIGVEAGEPFYVREALNVDDPVDLLTRPMNLYS
jgi:LmbE family N-acetylglucosaminyl deacetylase